MIPKSKPFDISPSLIGVLHSKEVTRYIIHSQIKQDITDYVTDQEEKSFNFIASTKGQLQRDQGK